MKAILKSIFLLLVFFVMLYVGMNNTDKIDFSVPTWPHGKIPRGRRPDLFRGLCRRRPRRYGLGIGGGAAKEQRQQGKVISAADAAEIVAKRSPRRLPLIE